VKLSRTPGSVQCPPPAFNEHADEILSEAGFSAQEVAQLRKAGVVTSERKKR
jgi:formyl-CoA transferase